MHGLDLINTSVLGALGCDMSVFLRYFPAAGTMYEIFVALAIDQMENNTAGIAKNAGPCKSFGIIYKLLSLSDSQ